MSLDLTLRIEAGSEADALIDAERAAQRVPDPTRIAEHMDIRDLHAVSVQRWEG